MRTVALAPLLLLTGCQSVSRPITSADFRKSTVTTPYVEFAGDEQIAALVAFAGNPRWKCSTCAPGQASDQVLTEVATVAALKPDLVVVQTGAYDLLADPTERAISLDANIDKILAAFEAAKIPTVICMLPATTEYDDYYFNEGLEQSFEAGLVPDIFTFNFTNSDLTAGLDYTPAGLADVYPDLYQEIERMGIGGAK